MTKLEDVKKILRRGFLNLEAARQICRLFPKSAENPEGLEPPPRFDEAHKDGKWVQLDENQELPAVEFSEIKDSVLSLSTDDFAKALAILGIWAERMKSNGWKKVKK